MLLIAALAASAPMPANAQSPDTAVAQTAPAPAMAFGRSSAVIEDVIETVDDGYRFDAYVVRWNGVRVLVSDPTGQGHLAVGDTLHFLALRLNANGQRVLSFISTEHAVNSSNHAGSDGVTSSSRSETSTVEEVLKAQEDGYEFTAYIVRWHGKRVGVVDIQSSPPMAVGDAMNLVVMRMSPMGSKLLGFLKSPPDTAQQASALKTEDTGIVEEVLQGRVDGDTYADYVVRWHGSRVAVSAAAAGPSADGTAQPPGIGEGIALSVSRAKLPAQSTGILRFAVRDPSDAPASLVPGPDFSIAVTPVKGTVERVLTAHADDFRYRAYIVTWQGREVAVEDAFSSTHFEAGDQVAFTVARMGPPGHGRLMFLLFGFPCAQGSSACKPPMAAIR